MTKNTIETLESGLATFRLGDAAARKKKKAASAMFIRHRTTTKTKKLQNEFKKPHIQ
ncbi:hypothetical protein PC116_g31399 [Phytophthora cactorum]|nr:hypothetical protein PC116_g31399 [Phytophthora cactorum]